MALLCRPCRRRQLVVALVVAAHVQQTVAERAAVDVEESLVLLHGAVRGQIALGDHCVDPCGGDVGDRAGVHRLGIGRLTRLDGEGVPLVDSVDLATDHLAEVHVVDRRDPAQQLTAARQRAHGSVPHLDVPIGREVVEHPGLGAVPHDDLVVGDGQHLGSLVWVHDPRIGSCARRHRTPPLFGVPRHANPLASGLVEFPPPDDLRDRKARNSGSARTDESGLRDARGETEPAGTTNVPRTASAT
ncbi:MAG: hypothetical protein V9E94_16230 [Microthrixaceae bacterium]